MNKGKEPVVQQRPNPSNPRLAGDDSPTSKPKKIFKINSKAEVPSPKHSPLKNAEPFFPQALPQKISLSRQSNRAQSVEKLPPPSINDMKNKVVVITRDSGVIRQPNKPVKVQEPESKEHKTAKSASPNKERVVREVPKVKENIQRKDTLEVVSEENEEHFRETLQGLKRKDSETLSKKPESPSKGTLSIIAVETIWDEYNLNKGRNIMAQKKSDEEEKSPKREKKDLVIETFKPYGESIKRDNEPGTPTAEEIRIASQVRGKFTKEHVLPAVRQKEQDQKKLMREYLDSQMDEKRRLKEEEKLRQIEEDKKEEARLRREMEQLNKQYEKELNSSKGSRQSDARTESPLKELRTKLLVKREDSPELKKLDYSDSEMKKTMKFKTLKETLKDEGLLRKDEGEKIGELSGHNNIKKLAEENEQLRNQNLRKNELIDILITALKNTGQDGPLSADQLRYTPAFSQPRAKSRTMHEKPPVPARTVENVDSPVFHKQDHIQLERNNTSPWSTAGGTYYAGLRSETDPDMTSEEPLSPISTGPQTSIRANENLSRLIGPNAYPELKLPAIPDFYSHRKGFSALVDQNNSSIKGKTFLSRSNMQTLETNASVSQSSSRMFSTPINSKISPRQFPLNISSPSNAVILKPKSEIMTTSVTPTLYSRHISQYTRSKPEGSPDIDIMSMGGRSTVELDSMKVVPSLTQLSVRKEKKGNLSAAFQVPGSPFRSSANIHPRGIVDPRSPIRVVDMGSGQQSTVNREKGAGNVERAEHKKSADGYAYPFMKEREPRFKDELISVRDGVKSVRSLDQYLEKGDIEMDTLKNRTKFPKEVFYLNLRKKVLV